VIATRNSADTIAQCVESVRTFQKVVIVDNYSKDATREIAQRLGAEICTESGAGFFGAYDIGFRRTDTAFVMFLDSDAYLSDFDLAAALAPFNDQRVGIVICLSHTPTTDTISKVMDGLWHWRNYQTQKYSRMGEMRWLDKQYSKFFMSQHIHSGATTTGPCYILRREAIERMGGMNRNADDFVLKYLLEKQGYKVRFYVSDSVFHLTRPTLKKLMREYMKHGLIGSEISAKFFSKKERVIGMLMSAMSIATAPYIAKNAREPRLLILVPLLRGIQAISFVIGTFVKVDRERGQTIGLR